ncbi:hypothetical protein SY2F82_07380 [Streptomyces sp. Y2F8-2]|nr:hypothetical protein SY2F82_07380 [Streptomyces sp. Y2F8-2]
METVDIVVPGAHGEIVYEIPINRWLLARRATDMHRTRFERRAPRRRQMVVGEAPLRDQRSLGHGRWRRWSHSPSWAARNTAATEGRTAYVAPVLRSGAAHQ